MNSFFEDDNYGFSADYYRAMSHIKYFTYKKNIFTAKAYFCNYQNISILLFEVYIHTLLFEVYIFHQKVQLLDQCFYHNYFILLNSEQ